MGLSERKNKQRIGTDPRNLTWSDDKSRFSYKHMQNLGWSDNTGIGRGLDGNPNHIAVVHRMDNSGIGMGRARKEGDDQAAGAGQAGRGLEDVLRRLAGSATASPSPLPESPAPSAGDEAVKVMRNRNASRQKHLNAKRMASASNTALAEILGVNASSLPASSVASPAAQSPQPSSGVQTPNVDTPPAAPEKDETDEIKSNMSVMDYFRMRMREKMQSRQAAGGPAAAVEQSADFGIPASKPVGGTAWEGSRQTFAEDGAQEAESSQMAQAASATSSLETSAEVAKPADRSETKAEKQARKAEKAARKTEKEARRAARAEKKKQAKAGPTATPGESVEQVATAVAPAAESRKRSRDGETKDKTKEEKRKKRKEGRE